MYLSQPEFMYSACGLFTKTKKEYKILRKRKFKTNLSKQYDMTYGDLQLQGKVLRDKAFNISKSLKYGGYEHDLA